MSPKPNTRKWSDVQTVIATMAIVATLGLWNLFSIPAKKEMSPTKDPVVPPTDPPVAAEPTRMPQVKIMFTQVAPQTTVIKPSQNITQTIIQNLTKKKKNKSNSGGGGGSVTQTKSS